MDTTQLALAAARAQMVRASVTAVLEDGTVIVTSHDGAHVIACDVLRPVDGLTLRLAEGEVVLVWHEGRDDARGVVMGRLGCRRGAADDAEAPDELVIEAGEQLEFRCGEGSITLRADGRILIKGKDLVSHAQRTNRIRGGAVAIN